MPHTQNFELPLLYAAQAQKEITHNEALVLIDALLGGCVEAVVNDPASINPDEGKAWIIGAAPVGVWSGRVGQIAVYSAGGWRFAPALPDMRLFDRSADVILTHNGTGWTAPVAIAEPSGGTTVDAEARATLAALLAALRSAGLLDAT